jgi:hypothetical protein
MAPFIATMEFQIIIQPNYHAYEQQHQVALQGLVL